MRNQEAQKTQLKEQLSQMIDDYYEKFAKSSDEPGFDINRIEQLMLEQQKQIREVLLEANSRLTSSVVMEVKKNAKSAKVQLAEPKKTNK